MKQFKEYLQSNTPITDEQFDALTNELKIKRLSKGDILLVRNIKTTLIYFVYSGLLRSYIIDNQEKEHIIQFAPESWWIGDRSSVYFGEPAEFYIDAIEESEVVVISDKFADLAVSLCPEFAKFNTKLLHNTARHMQKRIGLLLAATAEERYFSFIKMYPSLTERLSQIMMASYLGITPESLSRIKREYMKKNGNEN